MLIKFLCEGMYQKVAGNQDENLGSGSFSMGNCKSIRKFLDDLFIQSEVHRKIEMKGME